jgi:hypothetical protein
MAKSERLVIRLHSEDGDWFADRADATPAWSRAAEGGPSVAPGGLPKSAYRTSHAAAFRGRGEDRQSPFI